MLTAIFLMCSCDNVPLEHVNVSPFVKKFSSVWPHSRTYAKKLQEYQKGRFQTPRAHCKPLYATLKLKISFITATAFCLYLFVHKRDVAPSPPTPKVSHFDIYFAYLRKV